MKRLAALLALGLLGGFLWLPVAALAFAPDGHAECGCPLGACACGHAAPRPAAPPPCHQELAIEGRSCSKRPVQEAVPLPRLPEGELAALTVAPRLVPLAREWCREPVPPPQVDLAVEAPPPRG